MNIIEGSSVDLIEPFPTTEIPRAIGWLHCYNTLVTSDDGPNSPQEWQEFLRLFFSVSNVRSWGIIDKAHKLNIRHEAPLIGFGAFERTNSRNGYIHCATTRRAWGSGMVDEASKLAIDTIFEDSPDLLRISCFLIRNNAPAKALAKRLGFSIEGIMWDSILQDGIPQPMTHMGLTRKVWKENVDRHVEDSNNVESTTEPELAVR